MPSLKQIRQIAFQQTIVFPEPAPARHEISICNARIVVETKLTAEYDNMVLAYVYDHNNRGFIVLHDQHGNLIQPGKGQTKKSTIRALSNYLEKRFELATWEGKECLVNRISV